MNTSKDLNYRLYLQKEEGFQRTAFKSEFEKYAAIRAGNIELVKKNFEIIKKDFFKGKGNLSDNPVNNVRYHVIIASAITARLCVEGGLSHDTAYTLSDIYIQRADKCNSTEKLIEILGEMQLDFAKQMHENKHENATSIHVRRSIDYIYEHLNEKLTLEELAEYVGLNASYLSKLFLKETGSSFKAFVIEAKIKTAENMLKYSELSSLDISMSLGFSSQSAFVATFRKKKGITPKKYKDSYFQHLLYNSDNNTSDL